MFKHSSKLFAVLAAFALLFVYACEPSGNKQSKGKSKNMILASQVEFLKYKSLKNCTTITMVFIIKLTYQ